MAKKKPKEKVDWKVVCIGLACLTSIELYALSLGKNGLLLTSVMAIIAGVIGWRVPTDIIKR